MSFNTAVLGSIFFLLGAAVLGGAIVWTLMNRRWKILFLKFTDLEKREAQQRTDYQKKAKGYDLEIVARDRKMEAVNTEYSGYRMTAEQRYSELSNNIESTNLAFSSATAMANERYKDLLRELENEQLASTVLEREMLDQITQGAENYADLRTKFDQFKLMAHAREAQLTIELNQRKTSQKQSEDMAQLLRERDEQISRLNLAIGEMRLGTTLHGGAALPSGSPMEMSKQEAILNRMRAKAKDFDFSSMGIATYADHDDLKIVVGIGPFIEEKLFALGIYTFDQIARFNERDIKQVTEAIEIFPGRIERDHWVEQAQDLAQQKRDTKPERVN